MPYPFMLLTLSLKAACLMLASLAASAQTPPQPLASGPVMHHTAPGRAECSKAEPTALACAAVATPHVDARGRLWLAWAGGGAISVARSNDGGRRFDPAVVVAQPGAFMDGGADARPQIVVDPKGRVVVAYSQFKDKAYNAQVLISISTDDGVSFSPPRALSSDPASQRFPALALDADGALFVSWLDKRTVVAARKQGVAQAGAAVAYAWSRDGGASFGTERIAQDRTCECCRIAVSLTSHGRPVVVFRNIFGEGVRDHAVFTIGASGEAGPVYRVATDQWAIDGCPHHGPSVAVAADGSYHVAWFTQGAARQGLFYARSTDGGRTFSPPQATGDGGQQAGRATLLASGRRIWLVWKEFDGQRIRIRERHSSDAGLTWSPDHTLADTGAYADHPILVSQGGRAWVSWLTRDNGYQLIALDTP